MSKKRRQNNRSKKLPSRSTAKPTSLFRSLFARKGYVITLWLAIFAVLGWLATIAVFVPKVNLTVLDAVNPDDPFSAHFQVQNNEPFAVHGLEFSAVVDGRVGWVTLGKGLREKDLYLSDSPSSMPTFDPDRVSRIGSGDITTIKMTIDMHIGSHPNDRLDAAVTVSYRSGFPFWKRTKTQFFSTARSREGTFKWFSSAEDKHRPSGSP